jgi:ABC-type branched-subunit amino acid transport system substrate-binding protein
MTRLNHAWRLVAAGAAATLILASCGSDDDGGGDGGTEGGGGGETTAQGDGKLTLGSLLPQTGDLAFLGPPMFAGVDLALQDINEAGGVFGQEVGYVRGDSGDKASVATTTVNKLLNQDVDVIIGAAASDMSLSVLDKTATAGALLFSPANTSPELDTHPEEAMYARTAPSDILQGNVLGNMIVDDGAKNVAILARQDSYGENLADQTEKTIEERGVTVAAKVLYNVTAQQYSTEVQEVAASNPDAIAVIGFEETTKIIPQLVANDVGPQDVQTYFVDGNTSNYGTDFAKGTLQGVKATYPGAELTNDFKQRLLSVDPDLKDFVYGPETYDAAIMSALGAIQADSDAGEAVSPAVIEISRDGTKCSDFASCADLLEQGEDIDYEGVSGPVDLLDTGSPSKATIGIFEYDNNNNNHNIDYVTGVIQD